MTCSLTRKYFTVFAVLYSWQKKRRTQKTNFITASVEVIKVAYDDAIKPAASEVGKALGTIGRTVNLALSPLRGLVWIWDKIEAWLAATIEQKLQKKDVPQERIVTPDPDVAVPAIESLRHTKLKEQYANLLATAIDSTTANQAHPSFVEIRKQITPDEARILQFLPRVGRREPLMDLHYDLPQKGRFILFRHLNTIGQDVHCSSEELVPQALDNHTRAGIVNH